jgi:hypothetical protein
VKIPHFQWDKNPQLIIFKQELEGSGNAEDGGISLDKRSVNGGIKMPKCGGINGNVHDVL